ncbi:NAD-dependent epimerase/dehydratase family protein [Candidatus Latescibacterota bacterium]
MRVLITGGAGFIGSWVARKVKDSGHDVLIIDNLSTGKKANIPNDVKFQECDIRDSYLDDQFQKFKPDTVLHLAAQASVSLSVKNPREDLDINLNGGLNLLECCRKHSVQHFVFSSTGGAIYGNVATGKAHENRPACPESPYAAAKASFELYLSVYAKLWGMKHTILRYSNIYGPRQDPFGEAGVIAIFCNKLCNNERPIMFAQKTLKDSGCLRDYLYVEDVAKANLIALEEKHGGIYNIGTGKTTSTQRIFDILSDISNVSVKPIYEPPRIGDVYRNVLDISKARRELSFEPGMRLIDGLQKTWDYFSLINNENTK